MPLEHIGGTEERLPATIRRAPRCLIADPSPDIALRIGSALRRIAPGIALAPAVEDGHQLFRRIGSHLPDLLFLDLHLPGIDGLTALRALERTPLVRAVCMARESLEGGRAAWEALQHGAIEVLPKRRRGGAEAISIDDDVLEERLSAALRIAGGMPGLPVSRLAGRPLRPADQERLELFAFDLPQRRLRAVVRFLAGSDLPRGRTLLLRLPHPASFARGLVEGLDRTLPLPVRSGAPGDPLARGHLYLLRDRMAAARDPRTGGWRILPDDLDRDPARSGCVGLAARGGDAGIVLCAPSAEGTEDSLRNLARSRTLLRLRPSRWRGSPGRLWLVTRVAPRVLAAPGRA